MPVEGPLELAMTHVTGSDGHRHACPRPQEIRAVATRLINWKDAPETCQNCLNATATRMVQGQPLCVSCRENRALQTASIALLDGRATTIMGDVSRPLLRGTAIVFDRPSVDLGGFVEYIRPEAVNRTLNEQTDLRALWNHDSADIIGRISAGTLSVRKEPGGLGVVIAPPDWASRYVESIGRGDVTGMSFAFRALDDEWTYDGPIPKRYVTDMRVSEVSAVTFPAYPDTTMAYREEPWKPSQKMRERMVRLRHRNAQEAR